MKRTLWTASTALALAFAGSVAVAAPYDHDRYDQRDVDQRRCYDCGRIERIESFNDHRSGTGGAVAGAVIGGLIGHQIGDGNGRTVATVAGAAGGAYAGKRIAENSNRISYRVTVRFHDGHYEDYTQKNLKGLYEGQEVRVRNGKIRAR